MLNLKTLALGSALALASLSSFAHDAGPSSHRVDQKQAAQQARIHEGVAHGQLTRREAHRLQREQAAIRAAEARAKADGRITRQERRELQRMQARANRHIEAQKHDHQISRR
jgi:uncharacterized membrane protein YebE (DUF533 family)